MLDYMQWGGWGLAALGLTGIGLVAAWRAFGRRGDDHPDRLVAFGKALGALAWTDQAQDGPELEKLRAALLNLVHPEIEYYYKARRWSSARSNLLRIGAWAFATAGVLTPLIAASVPHLKEYSSYGYIAFAAAAALLLANELFSGTVGQIRYITAQFALERRVVKFELDWQAMKVTPAGSTILAFCLLQQFAADIGEIIKDETAQWATDVQAALAKLGAMKAGR